MNGYRKIVHDKRATNIEKIIALAGADVGRFFIPTFKIGADIAHIKALKTAYI